MTTKDHELQRLADQLRIRDLEIKQMKDADIHRGSLLTSAIQTYVSRSPYNA